MQWNSKGRLKAILTGVMVEVIVLSGLAHAHPATVAPHAKTLLIQQQASMLSHVKAMAVQELGQLHRMQATATQAARTVQFSLNGEQQMEEMMLGTSQVIRHLANHSPKNLHQLGALHSTVHQIRQESLDVQGQSQIVKIDLARWSAALEKWRMGIQQARQSVTLYTLDAQNLHYLSNSDHAISSPRGPQQVTQSNAELRQEVVTWHHNLLLQENILQQTNATRAAIVRRFGR